MNVSRFLLRLSLVIAGLFAFLVLLWTFAVPLDLVQATLEETLSSAGGPSFSTSMTGLRKGLLFSLNADEVDLLLDGIPAVRITDVTSDPDPRSLRQWQLGFNVKGKLGAGGFHGYVTYPSQGDILIDGAALTAVPYLSRLGIRSKGFLSGRILYHPDGADVEFEIPDLAIDREATALPLIENFHRVQGKLTVKGKEITVDSVSLDGDKGYARLQGNVKEGIMDLDLELMPVMDSLTPLESMIIGKYVVSPGYYRIPITGAMP